MAASKKRQSADLLPRLLDFLHCHVSPGQHLLLGLSGGLDSRVLLDLLVEARQHFDFHLSAMHVHHGLSPQADVWADFCRRICAEYEIPFQQAEVDVDRQSGLGIEATAREARYQALMAHSADHLVLAHHQDDQAETLVLQLLRGAGVHGLAGMPEASIGAAKSVLRPLLDMTRAQLQEYALRQGLSWVDDESNDDAGYDRNFLRHHIFPAIEERFPSYRRNLARSAAHLGETGELLDELAAEDASCSVTDGKLDIGRLHSLSEARAKNLLRWWIKRRTGLAPSTAKLQEILKQLHAREDAQVCVALGSYQLRRYRQWAYVETPAGPWQAVVEWHGEASLNLPSGVMTFEKTRGQGLSLRQLEGKQLSIRPRQGGERFRIDEKRPHRSLKNLFQEAGIPPSQRNGMPLVYADNELVFIPHIGIAPEYRASSDEPGLLIQWLLA
jgi:tRNA(Ile)-lysidine synthase